MHRQSIGGADACQLKQNQRVSNLKCMRHIQLILLLALVLLSGCNEGEYQLSDLFDQIDNTPPMLLSAQMVDQQHARLQFNENLKHDTATLNTRSNGIETLQVNGAAATVRFTRPLPLGSSVEVEGRFEDVRGNSIHFTLELWANNPNPASLLINEFTTKGSDTNPDRVELVATGRGNLAGLTLYAGTPENWSDRVVLPDRWVERGTYIVVLCSDDSMTDCDYEFDFKVGLGSNNGSLSLAANPSWGSPILDAVVWGNLTTTSNEGFGSAALLDQVTLLVKTGQWESKESKKVVDSTNSTATRSFCRNQGQDTNSNRDWYICATKKASFGSLNSTERFSE